MDKSKYFIKCDSCGKKIYFGSEIYQFDGYCGCYCSGECYANAHATTNILTPDEADNCRCRVYKEVVVTTEIEVTNIEEIKK